MTPVASLKEFSLKLWTLAVEPSQTIKAPDQRRQAKLLATLLIVFFWALVALAYTPRLSSTAAQQGQSSPIVPGTLTLLFCMYLLSRTRFTQLAAGLFVVSINLILFFSFLSAPTNATSLYYLVVPIFVSGLFFPITVTLLTCVVDIALLILMPSLRPAAVAVSSNIYFTITVAGAILAFIRFRNLLEKDRQLEITQVLKKVEALNQELTKTNEELRKANDVATESARVKDEFLAMMSHELRTPLNAIIGFTGIMLTDDEFNPKHKRMTERVEANSHRLLSLINDVLDISKIQSGHLEITPGNMSLKNALLRFQSQLSVLAERKGLKFTATLQPGFDQIYMDEDALWKIINNLVSNAIKFTDEGEVSLTITEQDCILVIRVADTGIGIPAHKQSIIFESFRQVDSSYARKYGGTGLGLAIVRHLCAAMGGTISVESIVGKGSTFTVILPLQTAISQPTQQQEMEKI